MLKALMFDLDGTLCDTLPLCIAAFRDAIARHTGRVPSDREIVATFGPSETGTLRHFVPHAAEAAEDTYLDVYDARHDELARTFAGIRELLDELSARGIPMALVTGKGARSAAISLERFSLTRYFTRIETGYADGPDKPRSLRRVLAAWSIAAGETAYVGDTAYDASAAREVGMLALHAGWSPTDGGMHVPGALEGVRSFGQPGDLLDWLRPRLEPAESLRADAGEVAAPAWLEWARELGAIAQNGLTYALSSYDRDRYARVRDISQAMLSAATGTHIGTVARLLAREVGHATPKADVRAVVLDGSRVLLVRERSDGGWALPGGWADVSDSPARAVEREVREESGLEVRATRLLAVYDTRNHAHPPDALYIWKVCFLCERTGGSLAHSDETDGAAFFDVDDLPPLSLPRITASQLRRLQRLALSPQEPAEFD